MLIFNTLWSVMCKLKNVLLQRADSGDPAGGRPHQRRREVQAAALQVMSHLWSFKCVSWFLLEYLVSFRPLMYNLDKNIFSLHDTSARTGGGREGGECQVAARLNQVSCDWWRAGHVTAVLTSDWPAGGRRAQHLPGGAHRQERHRHARHRAGDVPQRAATRLQVHSKYFSASLQIFFHHCDIFSNLFVFKIFLCVKKFNFVQVSPGPETTLW